jgi:hypothetical protein
MLANPKTTTAAAIIIVMSTPIGPASQQAPNREDDDGDRWQHPRRLEEEWATIFVNVYPTEYEWFVCFLCPP